MTSIPECLNQPRIIYLSSNFFRRRPRNYPLRYKVCYLVPAGDSLTIPFSSILAQTLLIYVVVQGKSSKLRNKRVVVVAHLGEQLLLSPEFRSSYPGMGQIYMERLLLEVLIR